MKKTIFVFMFTLLILNAAPGCMEKSRRLSGDEQRELRGLISKSKPELTNPLDIRFEDKVRLIGYDFDKPAVVPGQPFQITWYWSVEKEPGEGWLQFTHVADANNVSRINVDAQRPIRRLHPPEQWKAGEYIRDVQDLTLPIDWKSPEMKIYLGFWNGPHRMHVVKGPNDGDNRALGLTIPVKVVEAAKAKLVRIGAIRTSAPVKINGKFSEPDWQKAPLGGPFVNPINGEKGAINAFVRLMYDDANMYLAFEVADAYIRSKFTQHDDHLWEQDAVEVMADPDGDGKNYSRFRLPR